ncbi:MAG: DUF5320 domain-containing protein [bacterium]|nr:DUF5320 domain-containing protein [bacterium]
MPRGDGTGPQGMGPMSGRGAGFCAGFGRPGFMNSLGQGFGRGCGQGVGGFGWRHCFFASGLPGWIRFGAWGAKYQRLDPEIEKQSLRIRAQVLQSELDSIRERLSQVEAGSGSSGTGSGS